MQQSTVQITLRLGGLSCPACEQKIEDALAKLNGVTKAQVSYSTSMAKIAYDPDVVDADCIQETIEGSGYSVLTEDGPETAREGSSSGISFLFVGLILVGLYVIINNTVGFNFFPQVSQGMGYGMLFVAGLFTSIHCLAMCGGINLSQCAGCNGCENSGIYQRLKPSLLYNLGRVTSYTVLAWGRSGGTGLGCQHIAKR